MLGDLLEAEAWYRQHEVSACPRVQVDVPGTDQVGTSGVPCPRRSLAQGGQVGPVPFQVTTGSSGSTC